MSNEKMSNEDNGLDNAILGALLKARDGRHNFVQLRLNGGHATVTVEKGRYTVDVHYFDNRARVGINWNGAVSEQVDKIVVALLEMEQQKIKGEDK